MPRIKNSRPTKLVKRKKTLSLVFYQWHNLTEFCFTTGVILAIDWYLSCNSLLMILVSNCGTSLETPITVWCCFVWSMSLWQSPNKCLSFQGVHQHCTGTSESLSWKSNCLLWKSKTRVTSSNPRVTSSNSRVTSSNSRVRTLKARVARLKARVGRLKARVRRLKARVEAIKPRVR